MQVVVILLLIAMILGGAYAAKNYFGREQTDEQNDKTFLVVLFVLALVFAVVAGNANQQGARFR
jgi:uncharacterized protein YneF (UPF0154 family)